MLGCRVPPEWKEQLETMAAQEGKHVSQILYEVIGNYLSTIEESSSNAKIREFLQRTDALESNPLIATLSQRVQELEAKLGSIQKALATRTYSQSGEHQEKIMLTSEELALILGVTSRAINNAASKGPEHFIKWTAQFRKGGKWTFEVLNPGMKKCDRRFIQLY